MSNIKNFYSLYTNKMKTIKNLFYFFMCLLLVGNSFAWTPLPSIPTFTQDDPVAWNSISADWWIAVTQWVSWTVAFLEDFAPGWAISNSGALAFNNDLSIWGNLWIWTLTPNADSNLHIKDTDWNAEIAIQSQWQDHWAIYQESSDWKLKFWNNGSDNILELSENNVVTINWTLVVVNVGDFKWCWTLTSLDSFPNEAWLTWTLGATTLNPLNPVPNDNTLCAEWFNFTGSNITLNWEKWEWSCINDSDPSDNGTCSIWAKIDWECNNITEIEAEKCNVWNFVKISEDKWLCEWINGWNTASCPWVSSNDTFCEAWVIGKNANTPDVPCLGCLIQDDVDEVEVLTTLETFINDAIENTVAEINVEIKECVDKVWLDKESVSLCTTSTANPEDIADMVTEKLIYSATTKLPLPDTSDKATVSYAVSEYMKKVKKEFKDSTSVDYKKLLTDKDSLITELKAEANSVANTHKTFLKEEVSKVIKTGLTKKWWTIEVPTGKVELNSFNAQYIVPKTLSWDQIKVTGSIKIEKGTPSETVWEKLYAAIATCSDTNWNLSNESLIWVNCKKWYVANSNNTDCVLPTNPPKICPLLYIDNDNTSDDLETVVDVNWNIDETQLEAVIGEAVANAVNTTADKAIKGIDQCIETNENSKTTYSSCINAQFSQSKIIWELKVNLYNHIQVIPWLESKSALPVLNTLVDQYIENVIQEQGGQVLTTLWESKAFQSELIPAINADFAFVAANSSPATAELKKKVKELMTQELNFGGSVGIAKWNKANNTTWTLSFDDLEWIYSISQLFIWDKAVINWYRFITNGVKLYKSAVECTDSPLSDSVYGKFKLTKPEEMVWIVCNAGFVENSSGECITATPPTSCNAACVWSGCDDASLLEGVNIVFTSQNDARAEEISNEIINLELDRWNSNNEIVEILEEIQSNENIWILALEAFPTVWGVNTIELKREFSHDMLEAVENIDEANVTNMTTLKSQLKTALSSASSNFMSSNSLNTASKQIWSANPTLTKSKFPWLAHAYYLPSLSFTANSNNVITAKSEATNITNWKEYYTAKFTCKGGRRLQASAETWPETVCDNNYDLVDGECVVSSCEAQCIWPACRAEKPVTNIILEIIAEEMQKNINNTLTNWNNQSYTVTNVIPCSNWSNTTSCVNLKNKLKEVFTWNSNNTVTNNNINWLANYINTYIGVNTISLDTGFSYMKINEDIKDLMSDNVINNTNLMNYIDTLDLKVTKSTSISSLKWTYFVPSLNNNTWISMISQPKNIMYGETISWKKNYIVWVECFNEKLIVKTKESETIECLPGFIQNTWLKDIACIPDNTSPIYIDPVWEVKEESVVRGSEIDIINTSIGWLQLSVVELQTNVGELENQQQALIWWDWGL